MKEKILISVLLVLATLAGCKPDDDDTQHNVKVNEQSVLSDFAYVVANPNYEDLQQKANELNVAVQTLDNFPTQINLEAAQDAWRAVRIPWEQAEGFLFGPAEDFNYDPATDTWPVNTVELDSLLASSNPLTLADIDSLQFALKGYHPIEYVLFGVGGSKTIAQLTSRERQYMISLTQSLYNAVTALRNSWDVSQPDNFTVQLVTAGNGSTRFATRKDAFIAIASAMEGICNEVANGKMDKPLAAHDSTLVESQYAHNATTDFKNNIIGVQNVYLCRYASTGTSLHNLVAEKNASLDNDIQAQLNAAIASLDLLDPNFGVAIFTQQGQIQEAQDAINILKGSLNNLINFIQTNITD